MASLHPATPGSRMRQAAAAVAALLALILLLGGVPLALIRFIGWPLPAHVPAWADIAAALSEPLSTGLLLDVLAVLCWIAWAAFGVDVARCALYAIRDRAGLPGMRVGRGPLHGLAAVLVGALLVPLLAGRAAAPANDRRPGPPDAPHVIVLTTEWQDAARPETASQARVWHETAVVRGPDPRTGVHDSLWRIAARELGDGARWPEIFALNRGKPQPDGGVFDRPSLVFPGEELRLPPPPSPDPGDGGQPASPAPPTTSTAVPPAPATTVSPPHTTTPVPPSRSAGNPAAPTSASGAPAAGGSGIEIGPDLYVGAGLASAVSAALLLARQRHRRRYRPGSGRREDLPVAPVVSELRLAHLRDTEDDGAEAHHPTNPSTDLGRDGVDEDADETEDADEVRAGGDPWPHAQRPVAPASVLGTRDGRPIALDVAAAHGLGLVGAGAEAAARAILLHALAGDPAAAAEVTVSVSTLTTLLAQPYTPTAPPGLRIAETLDDALDTLDSATLTRTARHGTHHAGEPPLLLLAEVPSAGPALRRLQAVLDNGSPYGVTGVLLGQWRAGVTAHVRADGTVSATDPGPAEILRGAALFRLGTDDTAALLALFAQAAPVPARSTGQQGGASTDTDRSVEIEDDPDDADPFDISFDELEVAAGPDIDSDGSDPRRAQPPGAAHAVVDAPEPTAGAARPVLRLDVLGPPRIWWRRVGDRSPREPGEVEFGDGPQPRDVTAAFQPRTRELLVFLAVHPEGATREALTAAIWPATPPERLANTVNTALSRLRRTVRAATGETVGDIVHAGDGRYRLDPGLVETDYLDFARARAARAAATTDEQHHAAHEALIDAYTGPLADGMAADWIDTARESLRRDALDAVAAAARALVDTDPQRTLGLLETGRAFDPHNELLYRDIMRLQARLGRLDAIPRTLSLLTTRLAELGEQPTPQTRELAAGLCRLREPAAAPRGSGQASQAGAAL